MPSSSWAAHTPWTLFPPKQLSHRPPGDLRQHLPRSLWCRHAISTVIFPILSPFCRRFPIVSAASSRRYHGHTIRHHPHNADAILPTSSSPLSNLYTNHPVSMPLRTSPVGPYEFLRRPTQDQRANENTPPSAQQTPPLHEITLYRAQPTTTYHPNTSSKMSSAPTNNATAATAGD